MELQPSLIAAMPSSPNATSKRQTLYEDMLRKCAVGQPYALPVEDGGTTRGLALRISRAAGRIGLDVRTASAKNADGEPFVAFEVTGNA